MGKCARLLAVVAAGSVMGTGVADAAPADWPPPVAFAQLTYDLGRCGTDVVNLASGVSARLDITVANQFDPDARVRIPEFLWMRELPVTIAPQTISVQFIVERPGVFGFSIDSPMLAGSAAAGCRGSLVIS
ncbi:hypothetical protein GL307_29290 [Nocardia seriolae]|uniref:hypothetical protein n=1 Tax=Nocardia seriolae TaxID=37332 RepID=UPI0012BCE718|nr:hypothetical protein [Nocardia seriolae]MTL15500.1 hypothetical protein [Nocardia seriolae]